MSPIKSQAAELGFSLCGVAPAAPPDHLDRFDEWLARDYAGEMNYLHARRDARADPNSLLPGVRSVVMLAADYLVRPIADDPPMPPGAGRVARYAQGADYHDVLRERLNVLGAWLDAELPGSRSRGVVDSAPLLERDFARRAGLGWFGKNTMLIHPKRGSFFFLAALLTSAELAPDEPFTHNHCGSCTRCLDACPTGAFAGPGWLDARKCISYLTIELKGPTPEPQREGNGDWLFGCDVCQEVCPWNRFAAPGSLPHDSALEALDLGELLGTDEAAFRARFKGTPLGRPKWRGLIRNALVVVANTRRRELRGRVEQLAHSSDETVAETAKWCLARLDAVIS